MHLLNNVSTTIENDLLGKNKKKTFPLLEEMIKNKCHINHLNHENRTILEVSIRENCETHVIQSLVDSGASPELWLPLTYYEEEYYESLFQGDSGDPTSESDLSLQPINYKEEIDIPLHELTMFHFVYYKAGKRRWDILKILFSAITIDSTKIISNIRYLPKVDYTNLNECNLQSLFRRLLDYMRIKKQRSWDVGDGELVSCLGHKTIKLFVLLGYFEPRLIHSIIDSYYFINEYNKVKTIFKKLVAKSDQSVLNEALWKVFDKFREFASQRFYHFRLKYGCNHHLHVSYEKLNENFLSIVATLLPLVDPTYTKGDKTFLHQCVSYDFPVSMLKLLINYGVHKASNAKSGGSCEPIEYMLMYVSEQRRSRKMEIDCYVPTDIIEKIKIMLDNTWFLGNEYLLRCDESYLPNDWHSNQACFSKQCKNELAYIKEWYDDFATMLELRFGRVVCRDIMSCFNIYCQF